MNARAGHTLAGFLVALVLTGLVCSALVGTFSAAQAVARRHAWMVRAREALRISGVVLGDELRFLDPRADIRAVSEDSVSIRAYRGVGTVCAVESDGTALVRYRGLRVPEPEKDSVVVVDAIGRARPMPLLESGPADGGCDARAGTTLYALSLPDPPTAGSLLLVFETGSYHLADRALRYRRGDGGRQPVTAELLDVRRSMFVPAFDAEAVDGEEEPQAVEGIVAVRAEARRGDVDARRLTARFRFPLLNARIGGVRP
ncbi:MAG TPA: hypothetical protein VF212_07995 [Longimicrobiales bacterium]